MWKSARAAQVSSPSVNIAGIISPNDKTISRNAPVARHRARLAGHGLFLDINDADTTAVREKVTFQGVIS